MRGSIPEPSQRFWTFPASNSPSYTAELEAASTRLPSGATDAAWTGSGNFTDRLSAAALAAILSWTSGLGGTRSTFT